LGTLEHADFLIVANAGGLLTRTSHPYGGLRGLWRAKDVQYSQTTKLRVRWYVDELLGGRRRGIYVALELDPRDYRLPDGTPVDPSLYDGALPTELVAPLARLRTDLDRFSPEEAGLLSYDAYWSTHTRLAALHPQLAVPAPSWREYADLAPEEVSRLRRLLLHGVRRIRLPKRG
jgi:hypothetical protein